MKKISVKVNTNAKENKIEEISSNNYKIKVTTIPQNGQANKKIIELLAKFFKMKKSNLTIKSGHKSNNKVITLEN